MHKMPAMKLAKQRSHFIPKMFKTHAENGFCIINATVKSLSPEAKPFENH